MQSRNGQYCIFTSLFSSCTFEIWSFKNWCVEWAFGHNLHWNSKTGMLILWIVCIWFDLCSAFRILEQFDSTTGIMFAASVEMLEVMIDFVFNAFVIYLISFWIQAPGLPVEFKTRLSSSLINSLSSIGSCGNSFLAELLFRCFRGAFGKEHTCRF